MIRIVTQGKDGPLLIFGITGGNVDRLKAGQPIHVEIGELFRQAAEAGADAPANGKLGLVLMYGETHRAVVDILRQTGMGGLKPDAEAEADAIDASLAAEPFPNR